MLLYVAVSIRWISIRFDAFFFFALSYLESLVYVEYVETGLRRRFLEIMNPEGGSDNGLYLGTISRYKDR